MDGRQQKRGDKVRGERIYTHSLEANGKFCRNDIILTIMDASSGLVATHLPRDARATSPIAAQIEPTLSFPRLPRLKEMRQWALHVAGFHACSAGRRGAVMQRNSHRISSFASSSSSNSTTASIGVDGDHLRASSKDLTQRFMENAAVLLVATCLNLSATTCAADALDLASAPEDRLLGVVRRLEAAADAARTAVMQAAPDVTFRGTSSADWSGSERAAKNLVEEVYDVVVQNFDDARRAGFEEKRWLAERDKVLNRPLRDTNAAHSAIREMLTRLNDPYSRYLTPEEFQSMKKYDVSGVGLNLGTLEDLKSKTGLIPPSSSELASAMQGGSQDSPVRASDSETAFSKPSTIEAESGGVWVVGVIGGSSADIAGLRQGDKLLAIDGSYVDGQTPFAVASLLQQGKESSGIETDTGSTSLTIRHLDGSQEEINITRAKTAPLLSPVISKLQNGDVGYIKLSSFNARAVRDVESAVKELKDRGAKRFVVDLKGNRGGLVSEGIEVARLFLDPGDVIVRPQGRARVGAPPAGDRAPLTKAPLTVLVNGRTASAAEIFAGSIQDNCRGVLIGDSTYGKGLIQSVYELTDGSGLVLTVGKYLTPNGTDIDYKGIAPDFGTFQFVSPQAIEDALHACKVRKGSQQLTFDSSMMEGMGGGVE